MAKLIITVGCSCSGKTTWASNFILNNDWSVFVERDQIRQSEFGVIGKAVLGKNEEDEVTEIQYEIVADGLYHDMTVIVSDTNLSQKYIDRWQTIAEEFDVDFEIKYFDVPLDILLERNLGRSSENQLPEKVIRQQYRRYINLVGRTELRPLILSSNKDNCFVFDLDGTVQLMHRRSPYDGNKSYKDYPNTAVIIVLKGLMEAYPNCFFFAVSGRESSAYDVTYDALCDYGIEPDGLFMREEGDYRSDDIIKNEIYNEFILPYYNVIAVFDDRSKVVEMTRKLGLHTFQVADGDF